MMSRQFSDDGVLPNPGAPELVILISSWSLLQEADRESESGIRRQLELIREAGFDTYVGSPSYPQIGNLIREYDMRFSGIFSSSDPGAFAELISRNLELGSAPMDCQLADHDTPMDEAIDLAVRLMEEADRQGARVHLEVHRDTCTETPEKTAAITEGCRTKLGKLPLINFDFSHFAVVKHLHPANYFERLLLPNHELFQASNLWHLRPFNGHHNQIPITNGAGGFSPEYMEFRPFIREALALWLAGPRPENVFWVNPELGSTLGYGLSCFPPIWKDTVALANDIKAIWAELLVKLDIPRL
jgi:hypothetical protein